MNFQPPPAIAPVPDDGKPRPFWSVMIPTYNPREDYLAETLRSVLQQDPGPDQMQIEVVDDCSPNADVAALVREIAGDRVAVFRKPVNQGLAGCWNMCIERSRGEWVHILHQDDLVFPGFYESLKRGIAANPQVGAAYTRHAYCDNRGHWHRLSILEMSEPGIIPDFLDRLISEERVQCASIVVRRTTYRQIGEFNPRLAHTLDWEMWIRIASRFSVYYEPKILACWRNHDGSTTSKQVQSGENIRDHARAIDIWSKYLPPEKAGRLAMQARHRHAQGGLWLAEQLLNQGNYLGCFNQVNAALTCENSLQMQLAAARMRARVPIKRMRNKLRDWLKR